MDARATIFTYKGTQYPSYIKDGNACSFILPFAEQFCKGNGIDIGGFDSWVFPGARPINVVIPDEFDAMHLPPEQYDYIFSSHTLEHLPDYVGALLHWKEHLKPGATLFLYLPHPDMEYWLPQNNRKHLHHFHPEELRKTLSDLGFVDVLASERDLYWSFAIVCTLP